MSLNESTIEFKLSPKKVISDIYYKERLDLSTINNNKCLYLIKPLSDIKKAFNIFDNMLKDKKVKLSKTKEDAINLNLLNILNYEEIETNIKLKQCKINKEEAYTVLLKENEEMKKKISELERNIDEIKKEISTIKENQKKESEKNIELIIQNYLKRKQEEEIKKQKEEEIKRQEKEKIIRQEEEEKLKLNDNVNLINDFHIENDVNMKYFNTLSNGKLRTSSKAVAVYSIIRNNERLYELACRKRGSYNGYSDSKYNCNIAIYNILLNKKTNEIFDAHSSYINNIKHYYYSSSKKHFLLSSSYGDKKIKLWNISSKTFTNELTINVNNNNSYTDDYYYFYCCCLLFNNEDYLIISGGNKSQQTGCCTKIFNRGGSFQRCINNSELEQINYIEAAYIKNKPYVLLSGNYHAESYDYNNGSLIKYKSEDKDKNIYSSIINLFNKNNKTYLISGYSDGSVTIFDFEKKENNYIDSIQLGNTCIYSLCSLNENYFLVGDNKEIKVIDFENIDIKNSIKDLSDSTIQGIEKIKIPEKGEIIISYTSGIITLWINSN